MTRLLTIAIALVLWAPLLGACGGAAAIDEDGHDAAVGDLAGDATPTSTLPQVIAGGSDEQGNGFVSWEGGEFAPGVIHGPQGGQHIWVSALAKNLYPKKARIAVTMFDESGGLPGELVKPGRVEVTGTLKSWPAPPEPAGEWMIYAGLPAFVSEPCRISGHRLRAELEISDLYGIKAVHKAWIRPKWTFAACVQPGSSSGAGPAFVDWGDNTAQPALAVAGSGATLDLAVRILNVPVQAPKLAVTVIQMPVPDNGTEGLTVEPGRTVLDTQVAPDPVEPGSLWSLLKTVKVPISDPCAVAARKTHLLVEVLDGDQTLAVGQAYVTPKWLGACAK